MPYMVLTDTGATLPQETKDKLFVTSLENIEYSILLETEARTMKWGWLFRTYVQWHAIAFLLSELCVRTKGEAVDRAWRALEATAGRWWFPLNENSPTGRGQQGCLWKPLRKLLAKAKAARERELALERASIALRSGQAMFPGFPSGMDKVGIPPISVNQPSAERLDQMLRPSAPKLGDGPLAMRPSWPESPSLPHATASLEDGFGGRIERSRHSSSEGVQNNGNAGQNFADLANFGLGDVLQDVMSDVALDGSSIFDFSNLQANGTSTINSLPNLGPPTGLNNDATVSQPPNSASNTAAAIHGAHGTFGDTMFGNVDFGDTAMGDGNGNSNGNALTDSPIMDGGNIDWTMWDDMVTQYGGTQQNPNTNPASHMGLVHWF
jgi:hypothetical protein